IRMGVLRESTLIARRLCDRREYVVGSPAYFSQHPRPTRLVDLEQHNCLIGSRDHWLFLDKGARKDLVVKGNWQANSGPALVDAALRGIGLAQLPDYYVGEYLASGQDRKSTRLNSSHVKISYAVFCLKKKKNAQR